MRAIDLTGQRFGRLRVLDRAENSPPCASEIKNGRTTGDVRWNCACDCGEKVVVRATGLRRGSTRSCGCIVRELARKLQPPSSQKPAVRKRRASILAEIEELRAYSTWNEVAQMLDIKPDSLFRNLQRWEDAGVPIPFEWPKPVRQKKVKLEAGQRYGRLVIREPGPRSEPTARLPRGRVRWWADCDCGGQRLLDASQAKRAVGCGRCHNQDRSWKQSWGGTSA